MSQHSAASAAHHSLESPFRVEVRESLEGADLDEALALPGRIHEDFSVGAMVRSYERLFEEVIAGDGPPA